MIRNEKPEIVTSSQSERNHRYPIYRHVSNCEDVDISDTTELHVYAFENEKAKDEVGEVIESLKSNYIFATGTIWPDWLEGRVKELRPETLQSLEYKMQFGHEIAPSDIDEIEKPK